MASVAARPKSSTVVDPCGHGFTILATGEDLGDLEAAG
jgi:hypothetical protein